MTHHQGGRQTSPHLRLTPAEVKALWLQKCFAAKGYLYLLVLAHRKVEWSWRIDNVSAFCKEWDIPRRTFYKAKALLIAEGLLSEDIIGALELTPHQCAPEGTPVSHSAQVVQQTAQVVQQTAQVVQQTAHSTLETPDTQTACDSTSLNNFKTTTSQPLCVCEKEFLDENSRVRTEVSVSDRPPAQVENAESPYEAITPSKDTYAPPILLLVKKKFGINLGDPHLRRALERWPERVEVAIACLEEKEIEVKYPTRFLQKAIEEQWIPESQAKAKAPDEFREWFKEARERGLVVGSQRVDGQIMVYTVDERCVSFNDLRQLSWDALTAQLQAFPDEDPPVNTYPPEQNSQPLPEPEPAVSTILHRVNNAIVTQSPISPQLQADAERCHIDIPLLQAEWDLAVKPPPGAAVDDIRRAG